MRKYNIVCPHRKANPYRRMMKATKEHKVLPNLLNREFKQDIPAKVLLTDITYLFYKAGQKAYLSTILDASTNEILSYNLSKSLQINIVTQTIETCLIRLYLYIKKHLFIQIKVLTILVQFFKRNLRKKELDNLCLDEVTAGTTPRRNRFLDI